MTAEPLKIFMTGASGCIGHYIADALIHQTPHELYFLVRNPAKLQFDTQARPGITILQGDMREIQDFADLLKTIDRAILTATAWGGQSEVFDVNFIKTLRLMDLLDPKHCQQVLYFSTASILGRDNHPLKEAGQLGTDYIRTKYECYQQLHKRAIASKIITLFPTLVFGGDDHKPYSHLTSGLPDVLKWLDWIRFFRADASFHFIHAQDIAQVVLYLLGQPMAAIENHVALSKTIVLGNPAVTVNDTIADICAYFHRPIYIQIPLQLWLANLFIQIFKVQMASWDRFCLNYRHFTYQNPVSPATLGLPALAPKITDVLQHSHLPPDALQRMKSRTGQESQEARSGMN